MLTPEQKERLDELRSKDSLNEEQRKELADLEANEPEDPDQDAFDDAWDKDDWEGDDLTENDQEQEEDQPEEDEDEDSDSILSQTPDEDSDQDQDSADEDESEQEETPEQKIARLEAELAVTSQKMSSWEGRLSAEAKRANEAEQKLREAAGKGKMSDSSSSPDDDDEAEEKLNAFIKEFPDLEEPIRILIRKEARTIVDSRFGTVEESVTEIKDTLKQSADENHFVQISKAHPDWEKIRDSGALMAWIKKQPAIIQPRLNEIVEAGNTQEVIEMFDQYKKATGRAKPTTTSSRTVFKKKKAQLTEAVPASSAGPREKSTGPDKDDFDGAWDHWNKTEKK